MALKWYICNNSTGASLQIGAYKYLKVPYGKSQIEETIADKFPTILTKIIEEKKVLLVETPVETITKDSEEETVNRIKKEVKSKPRGRKSKKK